MQPADTAREVEVWVDRGNARPVPITQDFALPEWFVATVVPPEHELPICHFKVVVEHRRPVCDELRFERKPGSPALDGALLRRVPIADYVRRVVDEAGYAVVSRAEAERGVTIGGEQYPYPNLQPLDDERVVYPINGITRTPQYKTRPARVNTPEHLAEVADVYRRACARREPPTQAVMVEWATTRSTASRWIRRARDVGELGPAQPRKVGEVAQ